VGIRPTTRSLLVLELVSVLLIVVLMATVLVRLRSGFPPVTGRGGLSARVFSLPPGIGPDALALAATSGFLAFAGFESAAPLGEETVLPREEIPRAIWVSVVFGVVFHLACTATQSLGFGLGAAGVRRLGGSEAPLGELAAHFVGGPLASALDLGAALSAVAAGLGGVTVGARMIFAFARDGLGPRRLAAVSPTNPGSPGCTRRGDARRPTAADRLPAGADGTAGRLLPRHARGPRSAGGVRPDEHRRGAAHRAHRLPRGDAAAGAGDRGGWVRPLPERVAAATEPVPLVPLAVLVWLTAAVLLTASVSRLRAGPPGAGPSDQAE
jgi:hypothetical protein